MLLQSSHLNFSWCYEVLNIETFLYPKIEKKLNALEKKNSVSNEF